MSFYYRYLYLSLLKISSQKILPRASSSFQKAWLDRAELFKTRGSRAKFRAEPRLDTPLHHTFKYTIFLLIITILKNIYFYFFTLKIFYTQWLSGSQIDLQKSVSCSCSAIMRTFNQANIPKLDVSENFSLAPIFYAGP